MILMCTHDVPVASDLLADLAAAERVLRADIGQLHNRTAEPTATQCSAVRAVERVIATRTKQQAG
jgi:hypothetical protein